MWDKTKIKVCLKPAAIRKQNNKKRPNTLKHAEKQAVAESCSHNNVSGNYRKLLFYACAVWSRGVFGTPSCFSFRSLQAATAALRRPPSCTPELKNWDGEARAGSRRNLHVTHKESRPASSVITHEHWPPSRAGRRNAHEHLCVLDMCCNVPIKGGSARLAPDAARGG